MIIEFKNDHWTVLKAHVYSSKYCSKHAAKPEDILQLQGPALRRPPSRTLRLARTHERIEIENRN